MIINYLTETINVFRMDYVFVWIEFWKWNVWIELLKDNDIKLYKSNLAYILLIIFGKL